MPKAKSKSVEKRVKRKKNFGTSELEVLLQEITRRRDVLFSSLCAGCNNTNKKEAWKEVWRAVDADSGEGRTIEEVKKKWFDLKCETKKNIAKFHRQMQLTGEATPLSELDQRIGAIIGETPLSGVPFTLDTNRGINAELPPPSWAAAIMDESEVLQSQIKTEPELEWTEPSCSSTSTRAPPSPPPRLMSDVELNNQERIADTLEKIAASLDTISKTLYDMNKNLKRK
ncbi:unnamed protein product [Knipowitschia caucasica]